MYMYVYVYVYIYTHMIIPYVHIHMYMWRFPNSVGTPNHPAIGRISASSRFTICVPGRVWGSLEYVSWHLNISTTMGYRITIPFLYLSKNITRNIFIYNQNYNYS